MEEEAENDAEAILAEADVERPLMPWEQRKLESRPSGSKMGFKAPDSFLRLPLTAQAPGFAPGFVPNHVMEATQQHLACSVSDFGFDGTMQSFYPPRAGQRQSAGGEKKDTSARSSDPEDVWRAACLIPEGTAWCCSVSPAGGWEAAARQRTQRRQVGREGLEVHRDGDLVDFGRSAPEPRPAPAAWQSRGEPAPEPPAGPEDENLERPAEGWISPRSDRSVGPKMTKEAALGPGLTSGTTLVDLIDRGTYGMGPSGRRARSVQRSDSLPPRPWDQGTRASLEQAARAGAQLRSKSLRPARPERPRDENDPWAAYFGENSDGLDVPVWGQLPFRLHRRQHGVVRESEAELTTGHIPVLRDESIDSLLGGPDGVDGYYADGTFGRGGFGLI
eukprot:s515_g4.t1